MKTLQKNDIKMLRDKNVLLGITSSIAAYKSAELVRLFKKLGASVRVIQTEASLRFVSNLTLSTLSKNPVLHEMIDYDSSEWNNHVELGQWADFFVIAPLTANSMAKMSNGVCDNLLLATYLSAKCPVYFAPAMDLDMYKHTSTKNNIKKLQSFGNILIPSGFGELASGLIGEGRMAEPNEIVELIIKDLSKELPFTNKKILITAGPTFESIDPVRFIGNRSSGKMGVALAIECADKGAKVNLVLGPSSIELKHTNVIIHRVESASEMYEVVNDNFKSSDISIFSAAVSDYTCNNISENKIKKSGDTLEIKLHRTKDILLEMALNKSENQFIVGFSLETDNETDNALNKLKSKNLDMIVLNSLNNSHSGFNYNTNQITIIDKEENFTNFELKPKNEVASDIVSKIIELNI
jgi:phosphopantothenoylcysteine decarboxylase/phosphopantothenate--cysteine ligase